MSDITPQNWISLLKIANESIDPQTGNISSGQSIIPLGNTFIAVDESQCDVASLSLGIVKIAAISVKKLKDLRESYLHDEMKEQEYIDQTNDILSLSFQLISKEEKERKTSFKRNLKKALSAIFSLVIVGIPFYLKFYEEDKKFNEDMKRLKQDISKGNENNSAAIILKKIQQIPSTLEEIKKNFTDERRLELINDQIHADWQEIEAVPFHLKLPYDQEFEKDFKKGASFKRVDRLFHIEDENPLPSQDLPADQRPQQADLFLQELIKTAEDVRWKSILQIIVTRACLFTAFKAVLSYLSIDEADVQWKESGHFHSIKPILSDQTAPVVLEILRHPERKNIEVVHVTMNGNVDIVSYNTENSEIEKIVTPGVITEELRLTIAFLMDRPVVTHLQTQLRVNVLNPTYSFHA